MSIQPYVSTFHDISRPGCTVCLDIRFVDAGGPHRRGCPNCGCTCAPHRPGDPPTTCDGDVKSRELKAAAYIRNHGIPELKEIELTEKERATVCGWRLRWPSTSMLTMLSWIEGQRYGPDEMERDKGFQLDMACELAKWRTHRDTPD